MKVIYKLIIIVFFGLSCTDKNQNSPDNKNSIPKYNITLERRESFTNPQDILFEGYLELPEANFRRKIMHLEIESGKVREFQFGGDTLNHKCGAISFEVLNNTINNILYSFDDPANTYYMSYYPNGNKQSIMTLRKGKGFDSLLIEYNKDGKVWDVSHLENGNGFLITWSSTFNKYDTLFVQDGKFLEK